MTELVEGKTPRTFRLEFPVQLAAKVDNSATLVGQWFFVLPSPHESMTPSRVISAAQEVIVKPQFSGAMGLFMVSFVCCLVSTTLKLPNCRKNYNIHYSGNPFHENERQY